ncbi:MAG: ATP-binding protein [Chitinophagaceae bacterium]|nr:ATP-binding protein [Chitinophagaceae bacterium]
MIIRQLQQTIEQRLYKKKAILLFGARQTGKSTLAEAILEKSGKEYSVLNGDDGDVRDLFMKATATRLRMVFGKVKLVLIDEAQRIPQIGLAIKLITDQLKEVQVIATGSSSFELSGQVNEPLTGRKYEFMLYPLSFGEMVNHHGLLEEKRLIEHRMIYGYYPEIVTSPGEEKERLQLLAGSYLYKDLLMMDNIKKPVLLEKLLRALALQLGQEVNYTELGQLTGTDRKTVEKYIDLLEKAFVIFQLPAYAKNVRNEIRKSRKIYFYDCGIRNAVTGNFTPLNSRSDTGALWENFIIAERIKFLRNAGNDTRLYFWRTTQQQEIDLVEEDNGKMNAVEFKWNRKKNPRLPLTFRGAYPDATMQVVSPENIEDFLLAKG